MLPELLGLTDVETTVVVVSAVVALVASAFLGYRIGKRRDRPLLGVLLGGFLTIAGLFAIALMPNKEPTYY